MGGLPSPAEAADIWRKIWYQEAHHSTAIEGNTLVLKQVEALLAEGRAVGDKQLKDYMEVRGYADAAKWVYGQAIEPGDWSDGSHVSLTEIRRVHEMAMTPVWGYRAASGCDARRSARLLQGARHPAFPPGA